MSDEITNPIAALRTELSSVSPSQDFASRVRGRLADELEPLRAELADLAASPEFAVRVRRGIGASRRPAWGFSWRWAVPAAGLAAAVVAIVLWPRPQRQVQPAPTNSIARVDPAVPAAVASSTPLPAPPAIVARPVLTRTERRVALAQPAAPRDPMLEVITDQPEILRRLWANAQGDSAIASEEVGTSIDLMKDIEIRPIEVNPVVVKWFVEPPLSSGVWPIILRIAADMAERSTK